MVLTPYQVPASCVPVLQDLQCAARLILHLRLPKNRNMKGLARLTNEAETVLRSQQRSYTRRVETVMCTAPVAPQDLGPMIVALLERSIAQNDQIIALLRYQVSTCRIPAFE